MSTGTTADVSELAELRQLAGDIFAAAVEPVLDAQQRNIPFDPALWSTLGQAGLTLLSTPESVGGSGAGLPELAVALEQAGYHAAPVPLAENDLLASWLLQVAGLPVPTSVMTAACTDAALTGSRLVARLDSVPWGRHADTVVIAGRGFVAALPISATTVVESADIAAQPSDRIDVDTELDPRWFAQVEGDLAAEFRLRGALARSLQTCGALSRTLEMSSRHVSARVQFGRPLAKFQLVQHLIASAAGAVTLARSACDFAVDTVSRHGFDSDRARFAVTVAKIEAGRAATIVTRNAHQAHGAIGFTLDHRLRHFTTRALAWRSEYGGTRDWQHRLGSMVLESRCTAWEYVTANGSC